MSTNPRDVRLVSNSPNTTHNVPWRRKPEKGIPARDAFNKRSIVKFCPSSFLPLSPPPLTLLVPLLPFHLAFPFSLLCPGYPSTLSIAYLVSLHTRYRPCLYFLPLPPHSLFLPHTLFLPISLCPSSSKYGAIVLLAHYVFLLWNSKLA